MVPRLISAALTLLVLGVAGPAQTLAKKKRDPHIQRIYELVFRVVSLKSESPPRRSSSEAEFPHRLVTIHAVVTNVAKQFPCTELKPFLEVSPYYRYHSEWNETPSGFGELLPGQTVEVDYQFFIREGTTPVALVVKVRQSDSERCALHSDWGSMWHAQDEARVPVDDLPEKPTEK